MSYDNPRDEAAKLENLAKDDLKNHNDQTAKALLDEAFSIPHGEIYKVQAELKKSGSTSNTDRPEVFIDTRETQSMELVNGRQKTTIGEAPIGVVVSGTHYTGWTWATQDSTRYLYPGQPARTTNDAKELFPSWMQLPTPADLTKSFVGNLLRSLF